MDTNLLTKEQMQQRASKTVGSTYSASTPSSGLLTKEQMMQRASKLNPTNPSSKVGSSWDDYNKAITPSKTPVGSKPINTFGFNNMFTSATHNPLPDIYNAAKSGISQVKSGFEQTVKGAQSKDLKEGAYNLISGAGQEAAGVLNTVASPFTGTMSAIGKTQVTKDENVGDILNKPIQGIANIVSESPKLQEFVQKYPGLEQDIGNIITIGTALIGGKKAPEVRANLETPIPVEQPMKSPFQVAQENIRKSVEGLKAPQIDKLEADYYKWGGQTKTGLKNISKTEARTNALNKAGTEGVAPQRVLAEQGIIPSTEGNKFSTYDQAQALRAKVAPLHAVEMDMLKQMEYSTPAPTLNEIQSKIIGNIKSQRLTVGKEAAMIADVQNEMALLRERHGDTIPLSELGREKSAYSSPVKYDMTKPLQGDINYQISKGMRQLVENKAEQAGFPELAQLNRTIGDQLEAAKYLENLHGNTLKYGKIGKYVFMTIGASMAHTIPGKVIAALGGEYVADLLMKASVSDPVKRAILANLEKRDPASFVVAKKWLEDAGVMREVTPKIEAGNTLFMAPVVKPDTSYVKAVQAKKGLVDQNPTTGKLVGTYVSNPEGLTTNQPLNALDIANANKTQNNVSNIDKVSNKIEPRSSEVMNTIGNKEVGKIEIIQGDNNFGMTKIELSHPEVLPFIKNAFKNAKLVEKLNNMKILEGKASNGKTIRFIVDEQLGTKNGIIKKTFLNNAYFKE